MPSNLKITILGLSITSSWGNGHATTFRHLASALHQRGHEITFLERDVPWYSTQRDLPSPPYAATHLYADLDELREEHGPAVRQADLVIVGSYVPEGVAVAEWMLAEAQGVTAFYDIDTPVTLSKLAAENHEYINPELIRRFDLYLSFTGGPTLSFLEQHYGAARARPLYCSADPSVYYPASREIEYDLGYMGTYSADRQPPLEKLLLEPARRYPQGRFAVGGPQYPATIVWPENVRRIEHVPPSEHRSFYSSMRFTLNVTRADMIRCGYAPSIRLFEAAACGTLVISDAWRGLEQFFDLGTEILVASSPEEVLHHLQHMAEQDRKAISQRARERVLREHTSENRAAALESYVDEVVARQSVS